MIEQYRAQPAAGGGFRLIGPHGPAEFCKSFFATLPEAEAVIPVAEEAYEDGYMAGYDKGCADAFDGLRLDFLHDDFEKLIRLLKQTDATLSPELETALVAAESALVSLSHAI